MSGAPSSSAAPAAVGMSTLSASEDVGGHLDISRAWAEGECDEPFFPPALYLSLLTSVPSFESALAALHLQVEMDRSAIAASANNAQTRLETPPTPPSQQQNKGRRVLFFSCSLL